MYAPVYLPEIGNKPVWSLSALVAAVQAPAVAVAVRPPIVVVVSQPFVVVAALLIPPYA